MNVERIRADAQRIFDQQQAARPAWEQFSGRPATGLMAATLDEIAGHMTFCAELAEQHRVTVDWGRHWGKSREEIVQFCEARTAQEKRRAGVKALVKKYGHDSAARIVAKHSGRHIQ